MRTTCANFDDENEYGDPTGGMTEMTVGAFLREHYGETAGFEPWLEQSVHLAMLDPEFQSRLLRAWHVPAVLLAALVRDRRAIDAAHFALSRLVAPEPRLSEADVQINAGPYTVVFYGPRTTNASDRDRHREEILAFEGVIVPGVRREDAVENAIPHVCHSDNCVRLALSGYQLRAYMSQLRAVANGWRAPVIWDEEFGAPTPYIQDPEFRDPNPPTSSEVQF